MFENSLHLYFTSQVLVSMPSQVRFRFAPLQTAKSLSSSASLTFIPVLEIYIRHRPAACHLQCRLPNQTEKAEFRVKCKMCTGKSFTAETITYIGLHTMYTSTPLECRWIQATPACMMTLLPWPAMGRPADSNARTTCTKPKNENMGSIYIYILERISRAEHFARTYGGFHLK